MPSGPQSEIPVVALCGFMAAGKSTVGRELASLLRWRFIDLDCEIVCRCGQPIHEIFAQRGEARFREMESESLRHVLQQVETPTVIALGGGTFAQPQNAELLTGCGARVVFLELPVELLLERCRNAANRSPQNPRPLSADAEAFCALYEQRLPHYRKAKLTVHTRSKSAPQVAHEIAKVLRLWA